MDKRKALVENHSAVAFSMLCPSTHSCHGWEDLEYPQVKSNREYLPLGHCLLLFPLAQSKATLLDQFQKGTTPTKNPQHWED